MLTLELLPNETGYTFIGVFEDGSKSECIVRTNSIGMHNVYRVEDSAPCFFLLKGWEQKTMPNATGF